MNIRELTDRILADGKLTSQEQEQLLNAITEDGKVDAEEAEQIKRVMAKINSGELTVE